MQNWQQAQNGNTGQGKSQNRMNQTGPNNRGCGNGPGN